MRTSIATLLLSVTVIASTPGTPQVLQAPTEPPKATAVDAEWLRAATPIMVAGVYYYPTGPTVFFDGWVMVQIGIYQGVPVYADATLEPHSLVYVPVGGHVMRPYERRRSGEMAGTVGSLTPSFPVERSPEMVSEAEKIAPTQVETEAKRSSSAVVRRGEGIRVAAPSRLGATSGVVESIPLPCQNTGFWIEFDGKVWAASPSNDSDRPERFRVIGSHFGFPVYQDPDRPDEIHVPLFEGGAPARYVLSPSKTIQHRSVQSSCRQK